jgi:serine/threonine protein kinase
MTSMADETGKKDKHAVVTHDGRRVAIKPIDGWTDLRTALLLHDIRSPYLTRCLGRSHLNTGDVGDRTDERTSVVVEYKNFDSRHYEESKHLPFIECHPVPETPSFIFEWVNGRPMREIGGKELSSSLLERWFDDILDGLSWFSQCAGEPVAHLDISPDNIIITDSGEALLIDFAGARILDGNAQTPGTSRIFKEGYAAPEIFLGDLLPESDLYALAMSIFSVLCDEPATTLDRASFKGVLKKLTPSFADRLRCCLSEDPIVRRNALRPSSLRPISEKDRPSHVCHENRQQSSDEDDPCPYSFSTCPFLEVAYILCSTE